MFLLGWKPGRKGGIDVFLQVEPSQDQNKIAFLYVASLQQGLEKHSLT
jgi:hypothetical protein